MPGEMTCLEVQQSLLEMIVMLEQMPAESSPQIRLLLETTRGVSVHKHPIKGISSYDHGAPPDTRQMLDYLRQMIQYVLFELSSARRERDLAMRGHTP